MLFLLRLVYCQLEYISALKKHTDRFPINKKFGNDILSQPLEGWRRCGRKGIHFGEVVFFLSHDVS